MERTLLDLDVDLYSDIVSDGDTKIVTIFVQVLLVSLSRS